MCIRNVELWSRSDIEREARRGVLTRAQAPTSTTYHLRRGYALGEERARVSRQVEERGTQGGEPSQNEMDDIRGAISTGLELGGPPRMSGGAKERRTG